MFEKILQELQELEGLKHFSIPILPDQDGYIDKECPDEKCMFQFKVHDEDWTDLFENEKVFCPMCRHEANSKSWFTTEQINQGQQKVREHFVARISNALHEDARNFNARQSRNSFLKMSMRFTGSHGPDYILPLRSKEEMELKIQCQECNARYAVIGSAFFCPCCGHNSVEETFENAVKKIVAKIDNLDIVKEALVSSVGKDAAEITCRSLIETGLNDCVVAFQRYSEITFLKKGKGIKIRMNAFQNLNAGAALWLQAIGKTYTDWVTSSELQDLKVLFQKRHLLAHTEGFVDLKYIAESDDKSYKAGQRIVVRTNDVIHCLEIVKKIIAVLKQMT
jgi:hypothetical protein